jgi:endonuclease YncB( thermonuclease family)
MTKYDVLPAPLNFISVRVLGVDAPELHGKCKAEKDKALQAKAFLKTLIGDSKIITVTNFSWDKYGGRIDADVSVNGKDVATEMLKSGLVVAYKGGARRNWCN